MMILKRTVGVFYDIKVHLAEHAEDYTGMKGSTVSMGIRKVEILNQIILHFFNFRFHMNLTI